MVKEHDVSTGVSAYKQMRKCQIKGIWGSECIEGYVMTSSMS